MAVVIGEPLHEGCGEAAMVDLSVDDLPVPPELDEGGDADPDRPHAWRDHDADERSEDIERAREAHYEEPRPRFSGDPADGPIDSDASFRAWRRLGIPLRFLPSQTDLDKSTAPRT